MIPTMYKGLQLLLATTIRCGVRNPSRGKRWVIDWVGDISNNREVFGIATQKYLVYEQTENPNTSVRRAENTKIWILTDLKINI